MSGARKGTHDFSGVVIGLRVIITDQTPVAGGAIFSVCGQTPRQIGPVHCLGIAVPDPCIGHRVIGIAQQVEPEISVSPGRVIRNATQEFGDQRGAQTFQENGGVAVDIIELGQSGAVPAGQIAGLMGHPVSPPITAMSNSPRCG
ncbi:hypothetical protein [Palleronia caenipelagi]|uniref:hypothetical protein n=1 Tax=Palleronia caenipelagi TaxID=2489174 RepID=UPI00163D9203|nr:hypothetical protein [Palleronia caenipelagi]